jgi:uncharacterized protein HemY
LALEKLDNIQDISKEEKRRLNASIYHQLGYVAQEQRKWQQAEQYYKKALEIRIEFDDRYSQAEIYNYLGNVAQERQQWEQTEQYYRKALKISFEFKDVYLMEVALLNCSLRERGRK